jgi:hypothetical protein
MKPVSFVAVSILLAAVVMTFTATGCTPAKDTKKDVAGTDSAAPAAAPTGKDGKSKSAIKAGTGTIKGKIVFAGDMPKYDKTRMVLDNKDCNACPIPPGKDYWDSDQNWIVGKDKGVANVVVRLKVPADSYFEPSDVDKKKGDAVIDQPCCAYEPHVVVVYPSYFDGKEQKSTGQQLLVKNSASFQHNTNIKGNSRLGNDHNPTLAPKDEKKFALKAPDDIKVECNVHQWMRARIFVMDHPYAVVTKEDGTFEIPNINVGTKLTVEFWHEAKDVFKTETITLAEKETKSYGDITLSAK